MCGGVEVSSVWADIWPLIGSRKTHLHMWAPLFLGAIIHFTLCHSLYRKGPKGEVNAWTHGGHRDEGGYSLLERTGVKRPSHCSRGFSHSAVRAVLCYFGCAWSFLSRTQRGVKQLSHQAAVQHTFSDYFCYTVQLISDIFLGLTINKNIKIYFKTLHYDVKKSGRPETAVTWLFF